MEAFKEAREWVGLEFPVKSNVGEALYDWLDLASAYNQVACASNPRCLGTLIVNTPVGSQRDWPPVWQFLPESAMPRGANNDYEKDIGYVTAADQSLRLRWCKVRANSLIKERAYLPSVDLRVVYDQWEALLRTLNEGAPAALGDAMQVSGIGIGADNNKWLHMILQETYVRMAITGVLIGLGIALLVLLVATQNLVIGLLSTFTIFAALCSVVGSIVLMGWQLGSAESLSMMILTGFAVDYVVHLAHAYMESNAPTRLERTHDAVRDLGISVFWGMLTSVISAAVLASLQLQFFSKFGTFFLLTIIWSYLWSVLFLMPLLATIGPQANGTSPSTGNEMKSVGAKKEEGDHQGD